MDCLGVRQSDFSSLMFDWFLRDSEKRFLSDVRLPISVTDGGNDIIGSSLNADLGFWRLGDGTGVYVCGLRIKSGSRKLVSFVGESDSISGILSKVLSWCVGKTWLLDFCPLPEDEYFWREFRLSCIDRVLGEGAEDLEEDFALNRVLLLTSPARRSISDTIELSCTNFVSK